MTIIFEGDISYGFGFVTEDGVAIDLEGITNTEPIPVGTKSVQMQVSFDASRLWGRIIPVMEPLD